MPLHKKYFFINVMYICINMHYSNRYGNIIAQFCYELFKTGAFEYSAVIQVVLINAFMNRRCKIILIYL